MKNIKYNRIIIILLFFLQPAFFGCMNGTGSDSNNTNNAIYLYFTNKTTGNLGGRPGANAFCVAEKPPGLICNGGTLAFISVNTSDTAYTLNERFTNIPTKAPIMNYLKTVQIAENWADFTDGSINNTIESATGETSYFWTGGPDGTTTCDGWTDATTFDGTIGNPYTIDSTWFQNAGPPALSCNSLNPLLCLCWDD